MVDSTNPRVMADNIKMLAANGGATVEANPEGEAAADLEKLGVDGTIYGIPSIEANPEGAATEDLEKLRFGGMVYGIPGLNFSTTPVKIGKYMNGDLYAVIIDCGNVDAGAGGKTITHNISDISEIVFYYGIGYNSVESAFNLLPRVDNDVTYQRGMRVSATNIVIGGATNAPALANVKAIILYTKTTTS